MWRRGVRARGLSQQRRHRVVRVEPHELAAGEPPHRRIADAEPVRPAPVPERRDDRGAHAPEPPVPGLAPAQLRDRRRQAVAQALLDGAARAREAAQEGVDRDAARLRPAGMAAHPVGQHRQQRRPGLQRSERILLVGARALPSPAGRLPSRRHRVRALHRGGAAWTFGRRDGKGRTGPRRSERCATAPDRILTTHVGSLPRPQELIEAFVAEDRGMAIDRASYEATLREAVDRVVARQVALGIDIVDDGEFSKRGFAVYANERLEGLEARPKPRGIPWAGSREALAFPEFYEATPAARRGLARPLGRDGLRRAGPLQGPGAARPRPRQPPRRRRRPRRGGGVRAGDLPGRRRGQPDERALFLGTTRSSTPSPTR